MAENCNECSIAWIRGSDYAEVSAYNGKDVDEIIYTHVSNQHPDSLRFLSTNLVISKQLLKNI